MHPPIRLAAAARRRGRFALTPLAALAIALLHSPALRAQGVGALSEGMQAPDAASPALSQPVVPPAAAAAEGGLQPSDRLQERIPEAVRTGAPTFVFADRMSGRTDLETLLQGNAEVRKPGTVIKADQLEYYQPADHAKGRGNVLINREGNRYEGTELDLRVDAFEGYFNDVNYQFLRTGAVGDSSRIDFVDPDRTIIHDATYTTCKRYPGPDWMPAWVLRAASISMDSAADTGKAEKAQLEFKGVSVPVPSITFPLSEQRQTGALPPTIGVDNVNGIDVTLPYYWNLAPNRDVTLYPSVMSKRGVDLGGEFRYLENTYQGQMRGDYMPGDRLRGMDRWGMSVQHFGSVDTGIPAVGNIGLNVNLNRVSDDNYWRDFPRSSPYLIQRLLPADVSASWGRGDFSLQARSLRYQTLQDTSSPITPPYDRSIDLTGAYTRYDVKGFDYSVTANHTRFDRALGYSSQPNGERQLLQAQVSRPFVTPGSFITPKVLLNAASYRFDSPLATNGANNAQRTVPTFSLDSGLIFERDARFFGRAVRQTLEPRAFYVYTPYRNQNDLPVYDTAAYDFNFASVYTENAYSGNDRIADNNLLTLGLTTRLYDEKDGAQLARFGVAQRVRFTDQLVVLPGEQAANERLSDILLGAQVNWTPRWAVDTTLQYNPKTGNSNRATIGGRYSPSDYRTVNATYRYQRDPTTLQTKSEQIDMGWQWPINDLWGDKGQDLGRGMGQGSGRWYSVGRLNYSLADRRLVDTVVGLEYDGDCWIGRVVFERLQNSSTTATKRILFQIEFVGFSRVGSNPLQVLKRNIPRYQYLREEVTAPSRFSNYD